MSSRSRSSSPQYIKKPTSSSKSRRQRIKEYWNLGVYGNANTPEPHARSSPSSREERSRRGESPFTLPSAHSSPPQSKYASPQPVRSVGDSSSYGSMRDDVSSHTQSYRDAPAPSSKRSSPPRASLSLGPQDSNSNSSSCPARVHHGIKTDLSSLARDHKETLLSPASELVPFLSASRQASNAASKYNESSSKDASRAPFPSRPASATGGVGCGSRSQCESYDVSMKPLPLRPSNKSNPKHSHGKLPSLGKVPSPGAGPSNATFSQITEPSPSTITSPSSMDFQCKGPPSSSSFSSKPKYPTILTSRICHSHPPLLASDLCSECVASHAPPLAPPVPLPSSPSFAAHPSSDQVPSGLFFCLPSSVWQEAEQRGGGGGRSGSTELVGKETTKVGNDAIKTPLLPRGIGEENVAEQEKWDVGSPWIKNSDSAEYRWSEYFQGWRKRQQQQQQQQEDQEDHGGGKGKGKGKGKETPQLAPNDDHSDQFEDLEDVHLDRGRMGREAQQKGFQQQARTSSFYGFYDDFFRLLRD